MRAIVPATERPLFVCACGAEARETMLMLTYGGATPSASREAAESCWVKVREEVEAVGKHMLSSQVTFPF